MLNIPLIRCLNQQLISPQFTAPEKLVSWMGMVQAQDFGAAKMAVAMRLRCSSIERALKKVDKALDEGKIIRIHVCRPTWQFVAAEDVRWMCELSRESKARAFEGYCKQAGIVVLEDELSKAHAVISEDLRGGKSMDTRQIKELLTAAGLVTDAMHMTAYVWLGENRGLLCSGRLDGNRSTYALMDERVPQGQQIPRMDAVRRLADRYFRSHSPATLGDFVWWSGIRASEAGQAVLDLSEQNIINIRDGLAIHKDCRLHGRLKGVKLILPAFDEYLVGYSDRCHVLQDAFKRQVVTKNGIFFPVIMQEGQIVGTVRQGEERYFR